MKYFSLFISLLSIPTLLLGQMNTSLISQLNYDAPVNDIWGYVATDSTEYAIVGLQNGVSVVSLADASTPVEVGFAPGPSSGWRDIKTWETHAYAINETGDGLLVMDLSMLPDTMPYFYWSPQISDLGGQLTTCHNIFIDEFGYAYLAGCNLNGGGPIFVDVFSEPGNPIYAGKGDARYAHDVYARNNIMYGSDIYVGNFSVTNVIDKSNPILIASQPTPFLFTHNTWLSDDGNTLFTTDERADAPTAAYDISNLANIQLLDEFRPAATVGRGVIPHNTHVLNDFLITSHYTDGVVIVDAARPSNLIQVGQYDTFSGPDGGFNGCWGAYPFLPSGVILGSDRESGLFVIEPTYQRACYLEGLVRSVSSQEVLTGVEVTIESEEDNVTTTDLEGRFATGQVESGTFTARFTQFGYFPKEVEVELINGEVTELEILLESERRFSISGQVVNEENGGALPNAHLSIVSEEATYEVSTNEDGTFTLEDIVEDEYDVFVGAWGYLYQTATITPEN
ncbi:MAG: choice-of-anchor B family protein, partial [Bacteroidota bacterium]